MNEYPSAPLKMTLHVDWDVLSALHNALKCFPTQPTLHHVHSHQDNNPTRTALTLKEQLNSDGLATTSVRLLEPKPHVPFDSNSKFQLDFQGYTITWNLKPTLRKNLHLPAIQQYCERRMGWSSTTFDAIYWDIFPPSLPQTGKKESAMDQQDLPTKSPYREPIT